MKRILLSEKIKKAPPFLTIEPYLRPQDTPIASRPEAREPRLVPLVVIDYGSLAARIKQIRYIGKLLFCIQKCPADAIYPITKTMPDGAPAFIDHTKCAMPFSNDNGCTLCIKHCPFSVMDYDRLKAKFLQQTLSEVV